MINTMIKTNLGLRQCALAKKLWGISNSVLAPGNDQINEYDFIATYIEVFYDNDILKYDLIW